MSITRRSLLLSGAVIGAALAGSNSLAMAADQEITLGVVGVLSGPAAQWGLALRGAVEFAADLDHAVTIGLRGQYAGGAGSQIHPRPDRFARTHRPEADRQA